MDSGKMLITQIDTLESIIMNSDSDMEINNAMDLIGQIGEGASDLQFSADSTDERKFYRAIASRCARIEIRAHECNRI